MKILFLLTFFFVSSTHACLIDLTDQAQAVARQTLFNNSNAPGLRIGWSGMKELNKRFGLGGVNSVVANYESSMCNHFNSPEFRQAHPGLEVRIQKTDFKGYYLECTPTSSCRDIVERQFRQNLIPNPRFEDGTIFENNIVRANNYQEGYIRSRMAGVYPDERMNASNLSEFIDTEMRAAITQASGRSNVSTLDTGNTEFMQRLAQNVDNFRTTGIESVDPNFRRLVLGLDTLLEIPFTNSNNIENDLDVALRGGRPVGSYEVSSAQSGDDMFVIIQRDDQLVRVVGADAKGLGVENMTSRLAEFVSQTGGDGIDSMDDISSLSMRAIERADSRMSLSFHRYEEILGNQLRDTTANIDQALLRAHEIYSHEAQSNPELMTIRAGGISGPQASNQTIMNRITRIHNNLKTMEAAGISGHYGTSCLSTEYWLLRMGLQAK